MHGLEYGNGPIGLVLHIAGVMVIVHLRIVVITFTINLIQVLNVFNGHLVDSTWRLMGNKVILSF